ncbi:MAG: 3-keto-5-aminohexanoate cleavage protein [Gammaproteobacteria bacterium]
MSRDCDLLIGADSIHSAVRENLWDAAKPRFTGTVAWRATVPVAVLPAGLFRPVCTVWVGPCCPFNTGRTLISGTSVNNTRDMAMHLFMMFDHIQRIDPDSQITVCAAGRSGLYMTTLATIMGLNIWVGVEDTPWKFPNSDQHLKDNLEMSTMAREIAVMHGRVPATADQYCKLIGI